MSFFGFFNRQTWDKETSPSAPISEDAAIRAAASVARRVGGYVTYAQGRSMAPVLGQNTIRVWMNVERTQLRVGQIIRFVGSWEGRGHRPAEVIAHRIVRIEDGQIETKGTNNRTPDTNWSVDRVYGVLVGVFYFDPKQRFESDEARFALINELTKGKDSIA